MLHPLRRLQEQFPTQSPVNNPRWFTFNFCNLRIL
jgi:hypothetical protein